MIVTVQYSIAHLIALLQYLGPGIPPEYDPLLDVNADGWITIQDLLLMLANMSL